MNERIRELAEQARKNSARWGVYTEEEFYEKFAQLIVRECVNIANSGIDPDESHLIGDDIKKHFGVD